ncbi:Oidioi.mRNA.OKI2018_I69.chr2.g6710.t1.cds [Oikopleura dioica]|uniref:Oidioi.mRNA.OKI2018_I69.chr2.g6710.t1.cds n=1 Tax=Oikopleura dioica TaxID=34765 RepID=A0ABN7T671_OIKDI|nr:Oidioi.mRNA.OKI2018_I69.chr2.g6710.t1.cds [Oikopleura dioica]
MFIFVLQKIALFVFQNGIVCDRDSHERIFWDFLSATLLNFSKKKMLARSPEMQSSTTQRSLKRQYPFTGEVKTEVEEVDVVGDSDEQQTWEDSGYLSPEKKPETPLKSTPTLPAHISTPPVSVPGFLPFGLGGTYLPSHPSLIGAGLGLPQLPLSPHISPSVYSFMNILRASRQPGLLSTICGESDAPEQQTKRIRLDSSLSPPTPLMPGLNLWPLGPSPLFPQTNVTDAAAKVESLLSSQQKDWSVTPKRRPAYQSERTPGSEGDIPSSTSNSPSSSTNSPSSGKTFPCVHCKFVGTSLTEHKNHIRTCSQISLNCVCPYCHKRFARQWLLEGHIRTHTGEKPYVCDICNRAFADRSNMRSHRATHDPTRRHECDICHKSFSRNAVLEKHKKQRVCQRNRSRLSRVEQIPPTISLPPTNPLWLRSPWKIESTDKRNAIPQNEIPRIQ